MTLLKLSINRSFVTFQSLTAQNLPVLLVIEDSQKSGSQPWLETLNSHNSRAHLLLDIPPNMLPWSSLHGYPQETVDGSKDSIKHIFELTNGAICSPKQNDPSTFMRCKEMGSQHWVRFLLISPLEQKPYLWTHTDSLNLADILLGSLIPCPFKGIVDLSSTILRANILPSDRIHLGLLRKAPDEFDYKTEDIPLDPPNTLLFTVSHTREGPQGLLP